MNSQHGYILILTLCILSIMSLLWLSSMQHVLLFQQASNRLEEEHQRFYQLEFLARSIIKMPLDKQSSCILDLNEKTFCKIKVQSQQYQYQIEDLGEYPCIVIKKKEKLFSSHHYRYTFREKKSLLQIRVLVPGEVSYCDQKIKLVWTGISSWSFRYL